MPSKKTLYISDLDGTLLTNKSGLKDRAAELLKRLAENGTMFTYATARRFGSAGFRMKKAEIKLPVILMNGVIIADGKTGEIISLNGLEQADLSRIKKTAEQYGEAPIVYSFIDGSQKASYLESKKSRVKSYLDDRKGDSSIRSCSSYDELFEGNVHYLTFLNPSFTDEVKKELFGAEKGFAYTEYFDCYRKNELWLEVFSVNASKANAVKKLREMLNPDEVVVFGDNLNDLSMFYAADRAYAVSNAAEELKKTADGIIGSNEQISVPRFIEAEQTEVFAYSPHENVINEPNTARFEKAMAKSAEAAKARAENGQKAGTGAETGAETGSERGIGTLNEKRIHSVLKNYFSNDYDQEAKIGSFYADIVTENGIYEIQTGNFGKLNKKLEVMLSVCHVTVVYPYEKRTRVISADDRSGELLREGRFRYNNSLTDFLLELYRIKSFLTNPNLTICIAELDVERVNYISAKTGKRRKRGAFTKTPLALRREIYLEKPSDYLTLLPEDIPEEFTVKELQKYTKTTDAKLLLEILLYVGAADKIGKKGNAEIYSITL